MPGVGKGKGADLGFCTDGFESDIEDGIGSVVALDKGVVLLNIPYAFEKEGKITSQSKKA